MITKHRLTRRGNLLIVTAGVFFRRRQVYKGRPQVLRSVADFNESTKSLYDAMANGELNRDKLSRQIERFEAADAQVKEIDEHLQRLLDRLPHGHKFPDR